MKLKKRHLLWLILHVISPFLLCIIFIFFCSFAYANVNSDLNKFFNGLGFSGNVTAPHAYKGQEAGYYTGGSFFSRETVRDVELVHVEIPSYRSGCAGIDLFSGGFSFINADQLIVLFKNIMNNAKGYAFTLAMESVFPMGSSVKKYLTDQQNKINGNNINSCEMATGLLGSVWPKNAAVQHRVCEDIGTHSKFSIFSDMAAARQGCGAEGRTSEVLKRGAGSQFESMIFDEGNVAWMAIKKNQLLRDDTQLAELFMSLSGTIIIRKTGSGDDSPNQTPKFSSLATDQSLLKAILHGGVAEIYKCDEPEKCLRPIKQKITIKTSLKEQVHTMLVKMVDKIYSDERLSQQEIGLLQSTSLPVYKMLNIQSAFQQDRAIIDVAGYSGIIATDILFQYLRESLNIVRAGSSALQCTEAIMTDFQKGLNQAFNSVRSEQRNVYSQLSISVQLIEQTKLIEQTLAGSLSTNLNNNIEWARNV